jgi:hypothetical protein
MATARTPEFLHTKIEAAKCTNFFECLDGVLASKSKPWYMKGIRQLALKTSHIDEMESCSKHILEWGRYWAMAISRDEKGEVHDDVQGEAFNEADVKHLLDGEWDKVDWIHLAQDLEKWTDNVDPDPTEHLGNFATLHSITPIVFKTMKLLKVAREGESADDPTTCTGFMKCIVKLERRSRALPRGSAARNQAVDNLVSVLRAGLKEFGER